MPRVELVEKNQYSFSTNSVVRLDDINLGRHLDNIKLGLFLNEVRIRYLKALGFNGSDLGDGITGIITGDLCINYKAVARHGDELVIEAEIDEISKKSFRFFYRLKNKDAVIALAETGMICYHLKTGETLPVPKKFIETLQRYKKDHWALVPTSAAPTSSEQEARS